MGIALGLGAALSWGLADYFAAVASRRAGVLRVVLGFHVAALVPLTVLVIVTGALDPVTIGQVGVMVAVGAIGWLSYVAFYGALAIGPISVLSPIVSGYAAVTALFAVLFVGDQLSGLQAVAVVGTIAGAMLASADVREIARTRLQRRSALGFVLALCAMALLGAFVFGVSYYRQAIGWLAPIFLARGFAALFVLGHVLASGRSRRKVGRAVPATVPADPSDLADRAVQAGDEVVDIGGASAQRLKLVGIMMLLALVDTAGYVCFNLGVGEASTAIVAAASAPYAVVPILMGVSLFGERPSRAQWLGVAVVISGVIALGASA